MNHKQMNQEREACGGNTLKARSLDKIGENQKPRNGLKQECGHEAFQQKISYLVNVRYGVHSDPISAACHSCMPVMANHKNLQ